MRWNASGLAVLGACALCACPGLDLGTGRPFPCDPTAADTECAPGWVCGLDDVCHDGDAGGVYPCVTAANCTGGWVCGLEGVCHDPDAGAPYLCALLDAGVASALTDSWCAPGWRCDWLGRCVLPDPGEGQIQVPDAGTAARLLSPQLLYAFPDDVAFSFLQVTPARQPLAFGTVQNIAFLVDGGLTAVTRWSTVSPTYDAGVFSVAQYRWPQPLQSVSLAASPTRIYVETPTGLMAIDPDGGDYAFAPGIKGAQLRQPVLSPGGPALAAFNGVSYWMIGDDGGLSVLASGGVGGGAQPIQQLSSFVAPSCGDLLQWLAVDAAGNAWQAGWDAGGHALTAWRPLSLPGPTTGMFGPLTLVELQEADGLIAGVWNDVVGQGYGTLWATDGGCGEVGAELVSPDCDGCSNLVAVHPGFRGAVPGFYRVCGGSVNFYSFDPLSGLCTNLELTGTSPLTSEGLLRAEALPAAVGYAGFHGQLWYGQTIEDAQPLLLDGIPQALAAHADTALAGEGLQWFYLEPGWGLVRTFSAGRLEDALTAQVDGMPNWGVQGNGQVWEQFDLDDYQDGGELPGFPDDGTNGEEPTGFFPLVTLAAPIPNLDPSAAAVRFDANGNYVIAVASADTLIGGFINAMANSTTIDLRATLPTGSPITSLALGALSTAGSAENITGYALGNTGLYRFDANVNATQWPVSPVDLGTPFYDSTLTVFATPVKVFADGTQVWIGFQDGSVATLPHLIPVAPNLDPQFPSFFAGAPSPALDFGQLCGQIYVSTYVGIYRLEAPAPGQALGQWIVAQEVERAIEPATVASYADAVHFVNEGDELYVVSPYGAVAQVQGNCPP